MQKTLPLIYFLVTTTLGSQNFGNINGAVSYGDHNPISNALEFLENIKIRGLEDKLDAYTLPDIPYSECQTKVIEVGSGTIKFPLIPTSSPVKLSTTDTLNKADAYGGRISPSGRKEVLAPLSKEQFEQIYSRSIKSEKLTGNQRFPAISVVTKIDLGICTFVDNIINHQNMSDKIGNYAHGTTYTNPRNCSGVLPYIL